MKALPDVSIGDGTVYRDRAEAGARLALHLERYRSEHPVVLGIPRGGVPVAAEVARRLGADLDVIVARKLGAPGREELAIGAVTADGGRILNPDVVRALRVSDDYVAAVTARQMAEARAREQRFRGTRPPAALRGRLVILIDDGLATGATMIAAARAVRAHRPRRLIAAVPVGSGQAVEALAAEVDEVVCPLRPEPFIAIGLYYDDFSQVADAEVLELMQGTGR
jgi:putative phosphoribosyl transferase